MSPLDFGSALPRITRPLPPPDFQTLRHACDVIQFLNFTQFDPVLMLFFHFTIGFKLKSSDEMYREYLTFSFDCIAIANSKVPLFPSLLPLNFIKWTMEVIRLFLYLWPHNKKITCPQCHTYYETSKSSCCEDNNNIIIPVLESDIRVEINSIIFFITHFCTIQISIWQNWDQNYKAVATVVQGAVGDDRYWDTIWS